MLFRTFPILPFLISTALADVQITTPASGGKVSLTSGQLTVNWEEGKGRTALADLAGYTLFLMAGGNSDTNSGQVATFAGAGSLSGGALTASIPVTASSGPPDTNAFYIKCVAQKADGSGQVINYSNRFTIDGMSGSFPASSGGDSAAQVQAAYEQVKGDATAVPATVDGPSAAAPVAGTAAGSFAVSFQFQTGDIRYAPMQQRPGPSVSGTNMAPQYPTSTYQAASTYLPVATVVTTQTMSNPVKQSFRANSAAAATPPADDMARYLERWKD